MNQIAVMPRRLYGVLQHNVRFWVPALLLFVVLTGAQLWRAQGAAVWPGGAPGRVNASNAAVLAEIEERFGVRFVGIYVVAKGGLIDLRYRVVDAGKAKNFGHYTETSPLLLAQDGAVEVTLMMLHNHRVETGRVYYILYRNTDNVIQPGKPVTIQIGDLQLTDFYAE
jgi:hypothetical protein